MLVASYRIFHKRRREIVALTPFEKHARWNWVRSLRSGGTIISACGLTTWERVMKNITLGAFACALALASTGAAKPANADTITETISFTATNFFPIPNDDE